MLKPEDISDGIGLVEENLLQEAEEERQRLELRLRRRRRRMIQGTGMAAVLALCTLAGAGNQIGKWMTSIGQNMSGSMNIAVTEACLPAEEANAGFAASGNVSDTASGQDVEDSATEFTQGAAAVEAPKTIVAALYPDRVKNPHARFYETEEEEWGKGQITGSDHASAGEDAAEIVESAGDTIVSTIGDPEKQKEDYSYGIEESLEDENEEEAMDYLEKMKIWWQEKTDRQEAAQKVGSELSDCTEKLIAQLLTGADGENRAFSPVNLYLGLGMLAEITDGSSREQVLSLLGTSDMDRLRETADALWQSTWQDDGVVTARLAGSLWLDQQINYRQEAMEELAAVYRTSSFRGTMGSASYNELFHQWLNEQTGNLLQQQAEKMELDADTILCMAATIYYKAPWEEEFAEANNTIETFHGAKKDEEAVFMHQKDNRSYMRGDHYQAVIQKIQGDGSLLLILPEEGMKPDTLLQEKAVQELMTGRKISMEQVSVDLVLPRFDIVSDLDMIEDLKAMGVTDVFDPEASDFSPIIENPEAALSVFQHAARITADEKGMEAAAYTIMELKENAEIEMEQAVEMKLDRPFLMVIRDDNGLPLFIGMVNQVK